MSALNDGSFHCRRQTWLVCLALTAAILAAYRPLWHAQFVLFDDNDYVYRNDMVMKGLAWPGIVWALTTFRASNWHPLTWISHMADVQLYGLNAAGHHVTNLLLHIANSILLFLLLRRMTGAQWPSALAAGFFALHPMHVESVAWIAERKDVLSTFFWLLTVCAYSRYVQESRKGFYILSILLFALGLMAKPMLVTLPFVLLLLDYWPLRRPDVSVPRLVLEKIPYFILAAASCELTIIAQRHAATLNSLETVPLSLRLESVPIAYMFYLVKTIWPTRLAVLYPRPAVVPPGEVLLATLILAVITAWVVWRGRKQRFLPVGWLWFIGMLAPVIGLVQAGDLFIADRYDYLSSVGLFIIVIWGARDWMPRLGARPAAIAAGLALAGCAAATSLQAGYWVNSETLFKHALSITKDNAIIENNLGLALFLEQRYDESLPHLLRAVNLNPRDGRSHYNLGNLYLAQGRVADALTQYDIEVQLTPQEPVAQFNFGKVLLDNNLPADALAHLERAVQLSPQSAEYHRIFADACRRTGHETEAERQYEKSLEINPNNAEAAAALAWMLATSPDAALRNGARAAQWASLASRLTGDMDPKILAILAAARAEAGDYQAAAATMEQALHLVERTNQPGLVNSLRAQLAIYRAGKPFRDTSSN